jgi:predicted metalloendopeptidase
MVIWCDNEANLCLIYSTIFKQMKLIYGEDHTKEEREMQKKHIHINILQGLKAIVDQVLTRKLVDQLIARKEFDSIMAYNEQTLNAVIGKAIKTLWADPIVQKLWKRRNEFQIIDSVKYYVNKIDEILKPNYIPTFQDILHTRVRTSGILCDKYTIDGYEYELYDVGGQRNERKKWIHCFEGVNSILFVAALSEYDQTLFEDESVNRMVSLPIALFPCFLMTILCVA